MDIILGLVTNILEEGFIYGIMILGIYITYSVLDFPDLTVDGSFPLGGVVCGAMILLGMPPLLALLVAFLAGAAAGFVTGFLHVKLKITNLLSGILTMTALWSVNLVVNAGKAMVPFYDMPTIFNGALAKLLPKGFEVVIISFALVAVIKILMDLYLRTKSGLCLRATGANPQFVVGLGKNPGRYKILGLCLGNGLTALSGAVLAQQSESASINSGTGMVVMGLASVIIGITLFKRVRFVRATTAVLVGSVLYKTVLSVAMLLGLPTNYLRLLMAVLFVAALLLSGVINKRGGEVQ